MPKAEKKTETLDTFVDEQEFNFPAEGVTVMARSRAEAEEKVKALIPVAANPSDND